MQFSSRRHYEINYKHKQYLLESLALAAFYKLVMHNCPSNPTFYRVVNKTDNIITECIQIELAFL